MPTSSGDQATEHAPVLDGWDALFRSTVLLVTGKGGVGKSTAAATLALAGVASGRRTLLVEVEGRQSLSRLFATSDWDYEEREFRPGLWGTALDPAEAVYEYLELFYGLKRVQWVMQRSNALDFVTTAAPGLRDLLLIGKVYEVEARRPADGRRRYDLIVVDAPPTGRIVPFLQAPEAVTDIVRVGPIRRQSGRIREMLLDPRRTQAVLVTLLEEMPVRETLDGLAALRDAGVATGPVIANGLVAPRVDVDDLARLDEMGGEGLRSRAAAAGAKLSRRTADLAVELARGHVATRELQRDLHRQLVADGGSEALGLPLVPDGMDAAALRTLIWSLAFQVGAPDAVDADHLDTAAIDAVASLLHPAGAGT